MFLDDATLSRFQQDFNALLGAAPVPWQQRVFERFLAFGDPEKRPRRLDIPTGLGKTAVMALWWLAHAAGAPVPRRLVYVVDRRAVVDQATAMAETIRVHAGDDALAISTLRGQHADNRDWLADPAGVAIVVGTVDMIGSRLLFSGYGVSRGMRPYHAGLLGADTLLVLDESHLCPSFEALLRRIACESGGDLGVTGNAVLPVPRLHLLSLSATGEVPAQNEPGTLQLEESDKADPMLARRIAARKHLTIADPPAKPVEALAEEAWQLGTTPALARVLVFCDSRQTAVEVHGHLRKKLPKEDQGRANLLVGARRVHERAMLAAWLRETGFANGDGTAPAQPTFLVATAAGEVGVDLDADHMVCDLVTWERMVQRLGRVNRRGDHAGTGRTARIVVILRLGVTVGKADDTAAVARLRRPLDRLPAAEDQDQDDPAHAAPKQIQDGLFPVDDPPGDSRTAPRDASLGAITALKERAAKDERLKQTLTEATSKAPLYPSLTRALVDAWALTGLEDHTGRPEVAPWLRGWTADPPQSTLVWRRHLPRDTKGHALSDSEVTSFFEAARPQLPEMLEAESAHVRDVLKARATAFEKHTGSTAPWGHNAMLILLKRDRSVARAVPLEKLAKLDVTDLAGRTLIVDARLGGLDDTGLLDKSAGELAASRCGDDANVAPDLDPDCRVVPPSGEVDTPDPNVWTRALDLDCAEPEAETPQPLSVYVRRGGDRAGPGDPAITRVPQLLDAHTRMVEAAADEIAQDLGLTAEMRKMLRLAARFHDRGKARDRWQRAMGVRPDEGPFAKTAGGGNPRALDGFRHEFASLVEMQHDTEAADALAGLSSELCDLALHLVAAHHGHARPGIAPLDDATPPQLRRDRAREAALRFARLHRRWGPWGLAWWEALLRAADARASRRHDDASHAPKGPS